MPKLERRILIVDDDPEVLLSARLLLKRHYSQVLGLTDPRQLAKTLKQQAFDLVLMDLNFSPGETNGAEGLHYVQQVREFAPDTPIIALTAYGFIDMAVKAMKAGASDFISKPWENEALLAKVSSNLETKSPAPLHSPSPKSSPPSGAEEILQGQAPQMQKLYETIAKVARTDASVLILGENGTGKEVIARAIHAQSPRSEKAFVKVDLGAISETLFESELFGHQEGAFTDARTDRVGRFESAQGGTLFLDEIGNLSLPLQAKLLSALQNRQILRLGSNQAIPINVRLVCATNQPLYEQVHQMEFRQDLLYRINTVTLQVPPLRERLADLNAFLDFFLRRYGQQYQKEELRLSAQALEKLNRYPWPGNVRELKHAVERAVILGEGPELQAHDFSFHLESTEGFSLPKSLNLEAHEIALLRRALDAHQGNISQAAQALGITRASLYRRIEKYGL